MAASTVYNTQFYSSASAGGLKPGMPKVLPAGLQMTRIAYSFAATSVDEAGDKVVLAPFPHGARIEAIFIPSCVDLDTHETESLDADLVLSDGTTDTILWNAGTAFQGAQTNVMLMRGGALESVLADDEVDGYAELQFKVNTEAATDGTGALQMLVFWTLDAF